MPSRQASGTVVSRIESVLESVLGSLARHEPASIELASRRTENGIVETIQFPGNTHAEARKFARVLLILQIVHDALVSSTVLTKRNIFYQNQDLFSNQSQVNSLVDAVALTLSASREDLNIVATSKGLVAGRSSIRLTDGTIVDLALGDTGTAIPSPGSIDTFYFDHIRWILVVEKDAVFRTLCAKRYWDNAIVGPGLVMTAKGYPDLVTREFLQVIHKKASHLPILTLADYDVDGLNIVKSYRYSVDPTSRKTSTFNPGVQWLGITSNQLLRIEDEVSLRPLSSLGPLEMSEPSPGEEGDPSGSSLTSTGSQDPIRQITQRDRTVAVGVMNQLSRLGEEDTVAKRLTRELQVLLMMGSKCEIQWLDEAGDLVPWLDRELLQRC